ncbi:MULTISPECIES: hemolysin family protein [Bacteria]|uniref:hemolysin family protein n=1 Tax=Bacteria TaxID=2 RepID=UPI000F46E66B|nr:MULTISPECIES: hemolysin family protein [unclassified Curtobacterium]MBF4586360.1 HlyC/CorC family transporter [Curtobacterium sp. VKM Ac-2887]ROQ16450.1 putative hemolysin [Curtobacterium sp. PhB171]ROQ25474.1 putative hemolysin [Curtobacterium sp. PhB170]ROS36926.1 putative hemolysin [Curtobacterium sp. PhB131]ROS68777.1 putative hemolysin [Curtobacterium sp. PhB172]
MGADTWIAFGLVILFVLVGGVFAAAEIALVSLRESQLQQLERRGSRGLRVAELGRDPNRFLAAVQIGVTVAGFFSAAYGASSIAPDVAPVFTGLGLGQGAAETVALVLMTLVIAYLSLVFGELVPKRLALQRAEGFSMLVAPTLDRFATLMRPVIWVLSASTNLVVRALGGDPNARSESMSTEELRGLVDEHTGVDEQGRRIARSALDAGDRILRESMRPWYDVSTIDAALTIAEATDHAIEVGHTRYLVTSGGRDEVDGFVHLRDLLRPSDPSAPVSTLVRPVLALPETKSLSSAIADMRTDGHQIALVVDEYGGSAGMVTLEALLEDLVGRIRDEYDEPTAEHDGVDGSTVLEDLVADGGPALPDGDYETVGGLVQVHLDRVPEVGDVVAAGGHRLEVTAMDGHRVARVRITADVTL